MPVSGYRESLPAHEGARMGHHLHLVHCSHPWHGARPGALSVSDSLPIPPALIYLPVLSRSLIFLKQQSLVWEAAQIPAKANPSAAQGQHRSGFKDSF